MSGFFCFWDLQNQMGVYRKRIREASKVLRLDRATIRAVLYIKVPLYKVPKIVRHPYKEDPKGGPENYPNRTLIETPIETLIGTL